MQEYLRHAKYYFDHESLLRMFSQISEELKKKPGVVFITKDKNLLNIGYNPYLITEEYLDEHITSICDDFTKNTNKKSRLARWLQRLADANSRQFGTGELDCCSINSKH